MDSFSPSKMLHIFPTFAFGGQQVRLAALVNGFGEKISHEIHSLSDDIDARSLLPAHNNISVNKLLLSKSSFLNPAAIKALRQVILDSDADILCTYNWGTIEAVMANRLGGKLPHIHFEDGFGPDENLEQQKTRRIVLRRLVLGKSIVIVPSRKLEGLALNRWRLPEENVRYIPNGIDIDRFAMPERVYERGLLKIGSVGALRPEKNFKRLMRAFKAAFASSDNSLEIVGDGDERGSLEQLSSTLDSQDRIDLSGQNNTPETAYATFDIFAMSSDTEQMPLSLLEAMASGLPIAATDVGDIMDMVAEENRPFITPKDNEAALAASLESLARDPGLRRTLGAANAKKARDVFSLGKMIDAHQKLYASVVS